MDLGDFDGLDLDNLDGFDMSKLEFNMDLLYDNTTMFCSDIQPDIPTVTHDNNIKSRNGIEATEATFNQFHRFMERHPLTLNSDAIKTIQEGLPKPSVGLPTPIEPLVSPVFISPHSPLPIEPPKKVENLKQTVTAVEEPEELISNVETDMEQDDESDDSSDIKTKSLKKVISQIVDVLDPKQRAQLRKALGSKDSSSSNTESENDEISAKSSNRSTTQKRQNLRPPGVNGGLIICPWPVEGTEWAEFSRKEIVTPKNGYSVMAKESLAFIHIMNVLPPLYKDPELAHQYHNQKIHISYYFERGPYGNMPELFEAAFRRTLSSTDTKPRIPLGFTQDDKGNVFIWPTPPHLYVEEKSEAKNPLKRKVTRYFILPHKDNNELNCTFTVANYASIEEFEEKAKLLGIEYHSADLSIKDNKVTFHTDNDKAVRTYGLLYKNVVTCSGFSRRGLVHEDVSEDEIYKKAEELIQAKFPKFPSPIPIEHQQQTFVLSIKPPYRTAVIKIFKDHGSEYYTEDYCKHPKNAPLLYNSGPQLHPNQIKQIMDAYFWENIVPEFYKNDLELIQKKKDISFLYILNYYRSFGVTARLKNPNQKTGCNRGRPQAKSDGIDRLVIRNFKDTRIGSSPYIFVTPDGQPVPKFDGRKKKTEKKVGKKEKKSEGGKVEKKRKIPKLPNPSTKKIKVQRTQSAPHIPPSAKRNNIARTYSSETGPFDPPLTPPIFIFPLCDQTNIAPQFLNMGTESFPSTIIEDPMFTTEYPEQPNLLNVTPQNNYYFLDNPELPLPNNFEDFFLQNKDDDGFDFDPFQ